jgi:hypothetical protein
MTANALTASQREALARVYAFVLTLNERAADGDDPGGDTPTAASDPDEKPETGEL